MVAWAKGVQDFEGNLWPWSGRDYRKPGDQVVVLLGGRIPFVLRPNSDERGWLLVGETYLHDVRVLTGKVADLNANGLPKGKMKVYDIY
jgi:hypothetical protein